MDRFKETGVTIDSSLVVSNCETRGSGFNTSVNSTSGIRRATTNHAATTFSSIYTFVATVASFSSSAGQDTTRVYTNSATATFIVLGTTVALYSREISFASSHSVVWTKGTSSRVLGITQGVAATDTVRRNRRYRGVACGIKSKRGLRHTHASVADAVEGAVIHAGARYGNVVGGRIGPYQSARVGTALKIATVAVSVFGTRLPISAETSKCLFLASVVVGRRITDIEVRLQIAGETPETKFVSGRVAALIFSHRSGMALTINTSKGFERTDVTVRSTSGNTRATPRVGGINIEAKSA